MIACLAIFFTMGLSFGTWLSRLPTLRDVLGASTFEMSAYGLCLAVGSLAGMLLIGRLIERFGARRVMAIAVAAQVVTLPAAAVLFATGLVWPGLCVLFVFGLAFSSTDIAMNVSGANAERALGLPRLPLMHAFYSIGSVAALGIGAAAEALRVPLHWHFLVVLIIIAVVVFISLAFVPKNEDQAMRHGAAAIPVLESVTGDSLATTTGSVPIIAVSVPTAEASVAGAAAEVPDTMVPDAGKPAAELRAAPYRPWKDRRILLIGLITLVAGLFEGSASDWLPLSLVDGRGVSNEFGAVMLGLFFASVVVMRIAGSALLTRFGRVAMLRASLACAALGVLLVSLVPGTPAMILGTIAWGVGTGVCWPVTISAAADDPRTAVRGVSAVSAIGYTSMLLGPMAFGFLGEHLGLLQAFWLLPLFALVAVLVAGSTRPVDSSRPA